MFRRFLLSNAFCFGVSFRKKRMFVLQRILFTKQKQVVSIPKRKTDQFDLILVWWALSKNFKSSISADKQNVQNRQAAIQESTDTQSGRRTYKPACRQTGRNTGIQRQAQRKSCRGKQMCRQPSRRRRWANTWFFFHVRKQIPQLDSHIRRST
jgi:hypothetical protein